jgi:hypothetical protein
VRAMKRGTNKSSRKTIDTKGKPYMIKGKIDKKECECTVRNERGVRRGDGDRPPVVSATPSESSRRIYKRTGDEVGAFVCWRNQLRVSQIK